MKKRVISLILALMLVLSLVPTAALAANDAEVTVSFTAQAGGAFLFAPQINTAVKGDLAESYGYEDSVENGVSALDVLVRAHELLYGDAFTKDTATNYLAISVGDWGSWVSTVFEDTTGNSGFWVNGGYPNVDGMGTTVMTQAVTDGDFVEFFLYRDTTNWSDVYAWVEQDGAAVSAVEANVGGTVSVTIKGVPVMNGWTFADVSAVHAAGEAVSGATISYINTETGALTATGAVTDENGTATFAAPEAEGTYYIAVSRETEGTSPVILSCTKLTATEAATTEPQNPYDDIDTSWAKDAILFVTEEGLMNGVGTSFQPKGTLNRAMLATVLYRLAGSPEVTAESPFSDVKADSWYGSAVIWASENKIVNGNGDGTFSPTANITREQIATMLYRFAEFKGYDTSAENDLSAFADVTDISSWAKTSMVWAVGAGLINGTGSNDGVSILDPKGDATREQIATILQRFVEQFK